MQLHAYFTCITITSDESKIGVQLHHELWSTSSHGAQKQNVTSACDEGTKTFIHDWGSENSINHFFSKKKKDKWVEPGPIVAIILRQCWTPSPRQRSRHISWAHRELLNPFLDFVIRNHVANTLLMHHHLRLEQRDKENLNGVLQQSPLNLQQW